MLGMTHFWWCMHLRRASNARPYGCGGAGKHLGMFAGTGTDPEQSNLLEAILSAVNQKQP